MSQRVLWLLRCVKVGDLWAAWLFQLVSVGIVELQWRAWALLIVVIECLGEEPNIRRRLEVDCRMGSKWEN